MLHNFRDLGGLETKCDRLVKPNLLFRTGNLSHIGPETAKDLATEKGIRIYIDFRTGHEIKHFGAPESLIGQKIEWINLPINTDDPVFQSLRRPEMKDWLSLYHRLFENNVKSWLKFLHIVAEADAPMTYGCLFGKDRTGIASSILLEALNVKDDSITNDYSQTDKHIMPLYRRFESLWKDRELNDQEIFNHYLQTPANLMVQFLNFIRKQAVLSESKHLLTYLPYDTKTKLQARLLESK